MKKYKLKDDWKLIVKRAWSVRLSIVAAVFSALEMVLPIFEPMVPAKLFAALSFATIIAAAVARLVSQPNMTGDEK